VDDLRSAVRRLISDWHGRWHGATRELANRIEQATGQDHYKRLLREVGALRPSWEFITWVAEHCRPEAAPPDWAERQLEYLAGLWQKTRGSAPPGYAGRILIDGEVARSELSSPADATDELTRARLLEKERLAADARLEAQARQIGELTNEIARLKVELETALEERIREMRKYVIDIGVLFDQLQAVKQQLASSRDAEERYRIAEDAYRREIEELRRRESVILAERDEARELADHRYKELQATRLEADQAQQQLRSEIRALENEISNLRARAGEAYSTIESLGGREQIAVLLEELSTVLQEARRPERLSAPRTEPTHRYPTIIDHQGVLRSARHRRNAARPDEV
jgi:hypothetical protein